MRRKMEKVLIWFRLKHVKSIAHKYKNYLLGAFKIILGISTGVGFIVAFGLYSLIVGFMYATYVKGKKKAGNDRHMQYKYHFIIGILIIVANLAYMIYTSRIFIAGKELEYNYYALLIIALMCFVDLILTVINIPRKKSVIESAIKKVTLTTAFASLVTIQIGFTTMNGDYSANWHNAIFGLALGSMSVAIGVYMVIKYFMHCAKHEAQTKDQLID